MGDHYSPRSVNLLAVNAVDVPGEPELRLLDTARRLRDHGWETTFSTPGETPSDDMGFAWVHLDVGAVPMARDAVDEDVDVEHRVRAAQRRQQPPAHRRVEVDDVEALREAQRPRP